MALWYVAFYRAMQSPAKAACSAVAFCWPLLSLFAMRVRLSARMINIALSRTPRSESLS